MSDFLKEAQQLLNNNNTGSIKITDAMIGAPATRSNNVERIIDQDGEKQAILNEGEAVRLIFERPMQGFEGKYEMKLDWDDTFIEDLKRAGYRGASDDIIVAKWLRDLCNNVANELDSKDGNSAKELY